MKNNSYIIAFILLISSCTSEMEKSVMFGKYEPEKDAFVAFNGITKESVKGFKSSLYDQNGSVTAEIAVSTTFEKYPGGGILTLGCKNLVCYETAARILAGEYRLTKFKIGSDSETDYDSDKCGVIKFDIKPKEIVYLGQVTSGAILGQENPDNPINQVLMPEFSNKNTTKKDMARQIRDVIWHYDGLDEYGKLDNEGKKIKELLTIDNVVLRSPKNMDADKESFCKSLSKYNSFYSN